MAWQAGRTVTGRHGQDTSRNSGIGGGGGGGGGSSSSIAPYLALKRSK